MTSYAQQLMQLGQSLTQKPNGPAQPAPAQAPVSVAPQQAYQPPAPAMYANTMDNQLAWQNAPLEPGQKAINDMRPDPVAQADQPATNTTGTDPQAAFRQSLRASDPSNPVPSIASLPNGIGQDAMLRHLSVLLGRSS